MSDFYNDQEIDKIVFNYAVVDGAAAKGYTEASFEQKVEVHHHAKYKLPIVSPADSVYKYGAPSMEIDLPEGGLKLHIIGVGNNTFYIKRDPDLNMNTVDIHRDHQLVLTYQDTLAPSDGESPSASWKIVIGSTTYFFDGDSVLLRTENSSRKETYIKKRNKEVKPMSKFATLDIETLLGEGFLGDPDVDGVDEADQILTLYLISIFDGATPRAFL